MLLIDPAKRDGSSSIVTELRELSYHAGISSTTGRISSRAVSEPSIYLRPFKEIDTTTEPVNWEAKFERLELDPDRKKLLEFPSKELMGSNYPQLQPHGDGAGEVTTVDEWIQETVDLKNYERLTLRRTTRSAYPNPLAGASPTLQLGEPELQSKYKEDYSALSSEELAGIKAKLLAQLGALHEVQRVRAVKGGKSRVVEEGRSEPVVEIKLSTSKA
jgi:hypothetical protein